MGFPPPPNFPSPGPAPEAPAGISGSVSASATFGAPTTKATICGFSFPIPPILTLTFGIELSITLPNFPPAFPLPWIKLVLSCDPNDPIDISGGIGFGGGRASNAEPDPDLMENAA